MFQFWFSEKIWNKLYKLDNLMRITSILYQPGINNQNSPHNKLFSHCDFKTLKFVLIKMAFPENLVCLPNSLGTGLLHHLVFYTKVGKSKYKLMSLIYHMQSRILCTTCKTFTNTTKPLYRLHDWRYRIKFKKDADSWSTIPSWDLRQFLQNLQTQI